MKKPKPNALARRERQIMDVLYKLERATVAEVLRKLADQPSYSTVRAQLRILEEKGHVRHEEHGLRYVYVPTVPRDIARRSALRHLVETFFEGSAENLVATLLGGKISRISREELDRLARSRPSSTDIRTREALARRELDAHCFGAIKILQNRAPGAAAAMRRSRGHAAHLGISPATRSTSFRRCRLAGRPAAPRAFA